jgi:glycosyltransferase involved in cell wall biosynthesis
MSMNPELPMISVVTPCLNRVRFVEGAVLSVLRQEYPNVEHIVVDGASTDGTLEVLSRYPHLRVISEPDGGYVEAVNKAIRLAQGDIIGHLNSDDAYEDDVFFSVAQRFLHDPDLDTLCGGAVVFDDSAEGTPVIVVRYLSRREKELSFHNVTLGAPIINARFFRRHVYERLGLFDTRYPISSDRDFLIRAAIAGVKHAEIEPLVYHYRRHSGSLSINREGSHLGSLLEEHIELSERYLQNGSVPMEFRRLCRIWHTRETCRMVLQGCRTMGFRDAFRYAVRGVRHDGIWPWRVAPLLVARILRSPARTLARRQKVGRSGRQG